MNRLAPAHAAVSSLVELLGRRARQQPAQRAYTFLGEGEEELRHLTYGDLDREARAIGGLLQSLTVRGDRVLLVYPAGLEFVSAFFGCLYAGTVAIPTYPPGPARPDGTLPQLHAIATDAEPSLALTTASTLRVVERWLGEVPALRKLRWLTTDDVADAPAEEWRDPAIDGETLALLQYTSGSTARPKGVMVTHGNLVHNERMIRWAIREIEPCVVVSWLPVYHDMGLIGSLLYPFYVGGECVLMSPLAFLQRPVRWLRAISRYRATISTAPNFAYDLCVRKIPPEARATLDLRSWRVALNGAEPVRHETLERFAAAFEPCGFRREVFHPCYGLAEATLLVSGGHAGTGPVARPVRASLLEQGQVVDASDGESDARRVVGCGRVPPDLTIVIADPESGARCEPDRIGEIWVSGPSVAGGYWGRPEETRQTFAAWLSDSGEGPFLRTGDLGFVKGGELFVTGRLKDLIIIGGRNHHPHDIEHTVERSHAWVRPSACAAFSVDVDGEERLVVAAEVDHHRRPPTGVEEVVRSIRRAVAEHHQLPVYKVLLLRVGGIPKTSSGKLQRHACRTAFLAGAADALVSD
jgi:acyl-CoA synthetase (AMP-forming)/AMP-acid ligase II